MKIKQLISIALVGLLILLTACGDGSSVSNGETSQPAADSSKTNKETSQPAAESTPEVVKVDELRITFVPSADADSILATTEPLKHLVKDEMLKHGYDIGEVELTVGTSYEAAGEALASGSADIGFVSASVYTSFTDEVNLLLTSARYALNVNSDKVEDWNNNTPIVQVDDLIKASYTLVYAGPSPYGKELQAKVEAGEELTWEDLDKATWAVGNTTSNAGYLYPSLYLNRNFEKTVSDLSNVLPGTSYSVMFSQAANEQIDVFVSYSDARRDYADAWTGELARENEIWDDVKVIAVTDKVINDCVVASNTSETMQIEGIQEAFTQVMQDISKTEEGLSAIDVYDHKGYFVGDDADYDVLREVNELVKNSSAN